ncbi:MAG: hypothetical protein K9N46_12655 [Candidatus Marinimicrobia bacterium]|nr:hypothetical protein [Candidatus Neomarinimicrobiota bacterium]MCF7827557.1 hypothetical protein [Candidatus Neomarinimicrobiota bacterium]MCF7881581.1 hypothetical protein [Candidatus Neomarinimicrobiota bacterium]
MNTEELKKKRNRLLRISKINGGSIAVIAGIGTVLSLFSLSLNGILVGLGITAAGLLELRGHKTLGEDLAEARKWLLTSQILFFTVIVLYSAYQLSVFDAMNPLNTFSEDFRQTVLALAGSQQSVLNDLIAKAYRTTYIAIMVLSFFYQGGMWLYYNRVTKKMMT